MDDDDIAEREFREALAKRKGGKALKFKRAELLPDAPAKRLNAVIEDHGEGPTAQALLAWQARVSGTPIIDVAHDMGLSIGAAKELIKQVHAAVHDDLKENLNLNRQLDLDRVDGILAAFYPEARRGDVDCANVTLKALTHRAKLVGLEAPSDPGRSQPQNVLIWLQTQLPSINRIVDALPLEIAPAAPS